MIHWRRLTPCTLVTTARDTVLVCGGPTMEALLFVRALLWFVLLWLTDAQVFRTPSLLQVMSSVSKPLYLWWCGVGLLLLFLAYLTERRWFHLAGLLYAVFWWGSQAYILWRLAPNSVTAADASISGLMAAFAFLWLLWHPVRRPNA
jgi:hypothetical protein